MAASGSASGGTEISLMAAPRGRLTGDDELREGGWATGLDGKRVGLFARSDSEVLRHACDPTPLLTRLQTNQP